MSDYRQLRKGRSIESRIKEPSRQNLPKLYSLTRRDEYTRKEDQHREIEMDARMPSLLSLDEVPRAISAKAWAIYRRSDKQVMGAYNFKSRREMASLTKIMTCKCVIELCDDLKLDPQSTYFRVTANAASINGTIASLQPLEWLSIEDLLYGMMLPSGNDAAIVLGENIGAIMQFRESGQLDEYPEITSLDLTQSETQTSQYLQCFVDYMNLKAEQIRMTTTHFMNPHGLDQAGHFATCEDLLRLSLYCLKDRRFRKVVQTKSYECKSKVYRNKTQFERGIRWNNTNKLLGRGCFGMKTGYTSRAGGCLVTTYQISINEEPDTLVVILLGCKGQEDRFTDSTRLYQWAMRQMSKY